MADEPPWYSPKAKPLAPVPSTPGELLFEFHRERDHKFFRCELRDHGNWGVEAQFFEISASRSEDEGGEFFLSRRFDSSVAL